MQNKKGSDRIPQRLAGATVPLSGTGSISSHTDKASKKHVIPRDDRERSRSTERMGTGGNGHTPDGQCPPDPAGGVQRNIQHSDDLDRLAELAAAAPEAVDAALREADMLRSERELELEAGAKFVADERRRARLDAFVDGLMREDGVCSLSDLSAGTYILTIEPGGRMTAAPFRVVWGFLAGTVEGLLTGRVD